MWTIISAVLWSVSIICIIMLIVNYRKNAGRLKVISEGLITSAEPISKLPPVTMENIEEIEKVITAEIKEHFARFRNDIRVLLKDETAPETEAYFGHGEVFGFVEKSGFALKLTIVFSLLLILLFFGLPIFLSSMYITSNAYYEELVLAYYAAIGGGISIIVSYLIYSACEESAIKKSHYAVSYFNRALRHALPIASKASEAGMILDSNRQSREAFKESADIITQKIDSFATDEIAPMATMAFTTAIERHIAPIMQSYDKTLSELSTAINKKQEEGLSVMAESFSRILTEAVEAELNKMAEGMGDITEKLNNTTATLSELNSKLEDTIEKDRGLLSRTTEIATGFMAIQQQSNDSTREFTNRIADTQAVIIDMNEQLQSVLTRMQHVADDNKETADASAATLKENYETLRDLTESVKELIYLNKQEITEVIEFNKEENRIVTESLVSSVTDANRSLEEFGEGLRVVIEETTAALRGNLLSAYEDINNKMAEELKASSEILSTGINNATDNFENSIKMLQEGIGKIETTLQVNTDKMEFSLSGYTNRMEAVISGMTEVNEQMGLNIKAIPDSINESLKGTLNSHASFISEALERGLSQNAQTAEKLAGISQMISDAGTEQFDKATQAASRMLEEVVTEINRAMSGVGKELADTITNAQQESIEMVQKLSEETLKLKNEYDAYFVRIENQNKNTYEDLDFHLQNIVARFAEDTGGIIGNLSETLTDTMTVFESNTTAILSHLDEQTTSIGLYAKEINLDLQDLNANLRDSVGIFANSLKDGVESTFVELDGGLSDISTRLAGTLESLRDSVDNISKTIK